MSSIHKFTIALIQMVARANKQENLKHAEELIAEAVKQGPKLVALPECFNSPYGVNYFPEYAEDIPGDTSRFLSKLAEQYKIYLVGGTFPERDGAKLYNTCTVFGPDGSMLVRYRKLHLFDIDIPGKITFKESEVLTPGNDFATFNTPFCKVGLGICYDIRFPELAQIYSKSDCKLIIYPGAFNMTTGPSHWELLQRARAVDNQVYVAGVSTARDQSSTYTSWGHTSLVCPWGEVKGNLDDKEGILFGEIDLNHLDNVRKQIPVATQKRNDIYQLEALTNVK